MATPGPTPATHNPNWWRTIFASLALAILLRIGLSIPFVTTFVALGIIFLMQIVFTEMRTGIDTARGWMKFAGHMAMGVVIFLALRYFVAGVVGVYPIDTYNDPGGGIIGMLPSRDLSKILLWEIAFALIAGGLAATWTNGKSRGIIGTIFTVSLLVLSIQIGLPGYYSSWPDRGTVSTTLVNDGIVGAVAKGLWRAAFGRPNPSTPANATAPTATTPPGPAPTTRILGPCERPWSFQTFEIPAGGVPKYLCPGWKDFPLGGAITITNPSGRVLNDAPGVNNQFGWQPEGIYTFRSNPEGSKRSVRVFNRW